MSVSAELRELVDRGPIAHLSTINADGSPQVTVIWIGVDGDELVSGHMNLSQKVRNLQRDPRAVLSFEGPHTPGTFLAEHAIVRVTTTVEEGGAWPLLDRLARLYVGPDFTFPAPRNEGGYILRYSVDRVGGVGPWVPKS